MTAGGPAAAVAAAEMVQEGGAELQGGCEKDKKDTNDLSITLLTVVDADCWLR